MKEQILAIISKSLNVPVEDLHEESRIQEDLMADSLDVMDITMQIEEDFQVAFNDAEYQHMKTIKDLINIVSEKVNQK